MPCAVRVFSSMKLFAARCVFSIYGWHIHLYGCHIYIHGWRVHMYIRMYILYRKSFESGLGVLLYVISCIIMQPVHICIYIYISSIYIYVCIYMYVGMCVCIYL
jgi:hypothetical protein